MNQPDYTTLDAAGLNLQAVFDIDRLPVEFAAELRRRCDPLRQYRQLILLGHGGRTLWSAVQAAGLESADPIDEFSVRTVRQWLAGQGCPYEIIYPGEPSINLQTLGTLAGWHHVSPLMLGINEQWGTWFAYRVLLLADSDFTPSPPLVGVSPCASCVGRPCVAACPADALTDGFSLQKCLTCRKQPASLCRTTCLSRLACPVRREHRYETAQISHSYGISLRLIEQFG